MIQSKNLLPSKILLKKIIKTEKVTQSGIIVPSTAGKDPNISGIVCLIGSGVATTLDPAKPLQIGDQCLFNPHAFQTVRIDENDYLLLDCREILCYFTPESSL
jgi:co-chaperonin GroES (HSP10)